MNFNDLKNIFNNEEFMNNVLESLSDDDFFVTNKRPVYTLRECLDSVDDKILNNIYTNFKCLFKKDAKKNLSNDKIRELFFKELPKLFREFLDNLDKNDIEVIEKAIKNDGKTNSINITLVSNGFMYGFREKKGNVYVIPREFIDIYNEEMSDGKLKEREIKKLNFYIDFYIITNGFLEKAFFDDLIINYYELDVSVSDIEKAFKERDIVIFEEKYYCYSKLENNELINKIIKSKNKLSYKILDDAEIYDYFMYLNDFFTKIASVLKWDIDKAMSNLFPIIALSADSVGSHLEIIDKVYSFNKKNRKKIGEILEENMFNIRCWDLNGRTLDEYRLENTVNTMKLKSKPKKKDLKSLLNTLSDESINIINDYYEIDGDIDEIKDKIINDFGVLSSIFDREYVNYYINLDGKDFNDEIDIDDLQSGILFVYKNRDKLKFIVPDEIKNILENIEFNDEGDFDSEEIEELVAAYVSINGVIERDKLKELLCEININMTLRELDKIVKNIGFIIVDNKYYSYFEEDIDTINQLLEMKSLCPNYKLLDGNNYDEEFQFDLELTCLNQKELNLDEELLEDISNAALFLVKYGLFSKDMFKHALNEQGIKISDKKLKSIINLLMKYKNDIGIWAYNGYTKNEYQELFVNNESKKIGRNDPCPCGSGKKYKQCCGK